MLSVILIDYIRLCCSQKLLHLLETKAKSLDDVIKSFAHLVGEPFYCGRKGKKNKNNVSKSDLSGSLSDEH